MGKIINEYMILNDIIADSGVVSVTGDRYIEISDICNDSRKATPGSRVTMPMDRPTSLPPSRRAR